MESIDNCLIYTSLLFIGKNNIVAVVHVWEASSLCKISHSQYVHVSNRYMVHLNLTQGAICQLYLNNARKRLSQRTNWVGNQKSYPEIHKSLFHKIEWCILGSFLPFLYSEHVFESPVLLRAYYESNFIFPFMTFWTVDHLR